jgi:hypothetical protein
VSLVFLLEYGIHSLVAWVVAEVHVGDNTVETLDRITSVLVIGLYGFAAINTLIHMFDILVVHLVLSIWKAHRRKTELTSDVNSAH